MKAPLLIGLALILLTILIFSTPKTSTASKTEEKNAITTPAYYLPSEYQIMKFRETSRAASGETLFITTANKGSNQVTVIEAPVDPAFSCSDGKEHQISSTEVCLKDTQWENKMFKAVVFNKNTIQFQVSDFTGLSSEQDLLEIATFVINK